MLKSIAFANAFTAVGLGAYVACRALSLAAPDLLFNIGTSWFHTFNLDSTRAVTPFDIGTFLFGAVTFGAFVWIIAYAGAALYNNLAK
ncbi:MAG: hypothetical protein HYT08_03810 [Candidatus Levybacteria bacterium]|nr:hypothetical protein [Candidatus Levybacteria bacterium]